MHHVTLTDVHELDVLRGDEAERGAEVLDVLGLDRGPVVVAADLARRRELLHQLNQQQAVAQVRLQVLHLRLGDLEVAS